MQNHKEKHGRKNLYFNDNSKNSNIFINNSENFSNDDQFDDSSKTTQDQLVSFNSAMEIEWDHIESFYFVPYLPKNEVSQTGIFLGE